MTHKYKLCRMLGLYGLTLCLLGNFVRFLSCSDFFPNQLFSKNSFRNAIRVLNILDPDQVQHFIGPDLGPNCLQKVCKSSYLSSADNLSKQFGPRSGPTECPNSLTL